MKLSDQIAQLILETLEREKGIAEIQRNELAALFGCVPSQINYVLRSRFTPEQGYIIESRRGGGGYVRILRVDIDPNDALMRVVHSVGEHLNLVTARAILVNLTHQDLIPANIAQLISAAVSDQNFRAVDPKIRDEVRAGIFKKMLLTASM